MKKSKKKSTKKSAKKLEFEKKNRYEVGYAKKYKANTKTVNTKIKKNYYDIIEELRKKYKNYGNVAKKLGISQADLRKFRFYALGKKGGKKPSDSAVDKIQKKAQKHGVTVNKNVKLFATEAVPTNLIKLPTNFKVDRKAKYIHAIFSVKITHRDGTITNEIKSQVYNPKDKANTKKSILESVSNYFKFSLSSPYRVSVELLNFTITTLYKWHR